MLVYFEKLVYLKGFIKIKKIIEIGNFKIFLVKDIFIREKVDLIMVGVIGLNIFERLLIGLILEYILCYLKVDMLVVCDSKKIL